MATKPQKPPKKAVLHVRLDQALLDDFDAYAASIDPELPRSIAIRNVMRDKVAEHKAAA